MFQYAKRAGIFVYNKGEIDQKLTANVASKEHSTRYESQNNSADNRTFFFHFIHPEMIQNGCDVTEWMT